MSSAIFIIRTLTIEKGAYFDGRATQAPGANGREPVPGRGKTAKTEVAAG